MEIESTDGLGTIESTSARSTKRKSSEGAADTENIAPNLGPAAGIPVDKKPRSKSASAISTEDALSAVAAVKASGIARYQKPVARTLSSTVLANRGSDLNDKKRPSTGQLPPPPPMQQQQQQEEQGAEQSVHPPSMLGLDVALKRVQGFIGSSSDAAAGAVPSTPGSNGLLRRGRKTANRTPCADKLKNMFDSTITITEEKITAILAPVRDASKTTKAKFDFKEKCKKLEVANKELRDTLVKLVGETKQVREKCLWYESDSEARLREAHLQLQEVVQSNSIIKAGEHKAKKELLAANEKIAALEAVCSTLRGDTEKVRDLESRIGELVAKLASEQSNCRSQEVNLARVEKEFADAKQSAAEDLKLAKGQYEQHAEQLVSGYKDEISTLRAEVGRRQAEAERISNEKAEVDRKTSELREDIVKVQAVLREAEGCNQRQELEVGRLGKELDQTKEQLAQKDADWRSTLNSLNEMQRQVAEERGSSRAEMTSLQGRLSILEEERLSLTKVLAVKTEEACSAVRENNRLTEVIAGLEAKIFAKDSELLIFKEVSIQLEMERELRARSEVREEQERTERIAASAALYATQAECNTRFNEMKENLSKSIEGLKAEIATASLQRENALEEARRQADVVTGMENEVAQLRHALENASANHESVEKLGRVTGELEILRRRMRETAESKETEAVVTLNRIKDLEEQVKSGEVQRRKLHNIIQELRGNIRVFARVRPFLPNDGFETSALPEPSIMARGDGQSLKITKVAKSSDERSEDHSFTFDRVFGPSSTQDTVFQEVSEFVQVCCASLPSFFFPPCLLSAPLLTFPPLSPPP